MRKQAFRSPGILNYQPWQNAVSEWQLDSQKNPRYLQFCQMSPLLQMIWPLHIYIPYAWCIDMPHVAQLLHSATAALPGFHLAGFHCSFVSFLNAIHTNLTVNASLH